MHDEIHARIKNELEAQRQDILQAACEGLEAEIKDEVERLTNERRDELLEEFGKSLTDEAQDIRQQALENLSDDIDAAFSERWDERAKALLAEIEAERRLTVEVLT